MEVIIDGIPLRDIEDDEIKRRKMKEEGGRGGREREDGKLLAVYTALTYTHLLDYYLPYFQPYILPLA